MTCGWPTQGGWNSGRKVAISSRQMVDPRESEVEKIAGCRVDPVQILEDYQHRLRSGQPFELPQQRRKAALLLALRAQIKRRETIVAGQRKQLDEKGDLAGLGRRCEQRR